MKYLKMLGLAALAAMALMAFVGASTASATVLCKTESASCGSNDYASGTEIKSQLASGAVAKLKSIWATIECSKSTVAGKTNTTGGSGKAVTGTVETLTFAECTCAGGTAHVTTKTGGSLSVEYTSAHDGTLKGSETNVTIDCTALGTQCNYGTSSNIDLGTVNGGAPATLVANASVPRSAEDGSVFICGSSGTWTAEYEVTSPKPLYIEAS